MGSFVDAAWPKMPTNIANQIKMLAESAMHKKRCSQEKMMRDRQRRKSPALSKTAHDKYNDSDGYRKPPQNSLRLPNMHCNLLLFASTRKHFDAAHHFSVETYV